MSAKATFWAWRQPIKPATAKLVLLCLADCHNGDSGRCDPSVKYIAKTTGLDRKTVIAAIGTLVNHSVLSVEKRHGSSTDYCLKTSTEIGTSTDTGTGTQIGTGPVPISVPMAVPKTVPKPNKEPKSNLSCHKHVLPDDFQITREMRIWASNNVPTLDLDSATEEWADYWKGEGGKKADWVATWRNGMKLKVKWDGERSTSTEREDLIL
jgi:hypothetical protein